MGCSYGHFYYVSWLQVAAAPSGLGRWFVAPTVGELGVSGLDRCVLSGELSAVSGPGPSLGPNPCENVYPLPGGPLPVGFHELLWKLFFLRTLAL